MKQNTLYIIKCWQLFSFPSLFHPLDEYPPFTTTTKGILMGSLLCTVFMGKEKGEKDRDVCRGNALTGYHVLREVEELGKTKKSRKKRRIQITMKDTNMGK